MIYFCVVYGNKIHTFFYIKFHNIYVIIIPIKYTELDMAKNKLKKAAGYIRVSTEKQKQDGSHVRQKEKLDDWAEENNHSIEFFEDIAVSGQKEERKQYKKLMQQLENFDVVVVRELSRFGRDLQTVLKDIEKITEKDVDFVSLKEKMIDTTSAEGKMFLQIIGAFNEFWANIARERTEELIQQKKESGEGWGRPKKLDPKQAEKVREWRDRGLSYGKIKTLIEEDRDQFLDIDSISRRTVMDYCKNGEKE